MRVEELERRSERQHGSDHRLLHPPTEKHHEAADESGKERSRAGDEQSPLMKNGAAALFRRAVLGAGSIGANGSC
nr:hypothetical protein [Streptomyces sp. Termitarium-T10T-6]